MKNSRRIGALVAMAGAAVSVATVTVAAPAVAAHRGPQPVTTWLRAVRADTDTEVRVYWRTDRRICDAEVRVSARDVDIDYPGRARSATFSRGDNLRPGRSDYVEFDVNPDFDRAGIARLRTMISYDDCSRRARTQVRTFTLILPVLRNDRPGWPGRPGDNDGRPGDNDGRPGDNNGRPGDNNGRPDRPGDNNGWPGRPGDNNGRPGDNNGRPDRPGDNNGRPDRPGDNNGRPTRPTTPPTTAPTVTTPATTAPATTPAATTPAATTPAATATTTPAAVVTPTSTASAQGDRGHHHGHR
ncbi:hypothetical protein Ade02nite_23060 [Paractinoplanes deccanensis]|uniref:Uncharacterized protein n=1 Tax=Paractinoplanes deccanensis TaxID=113561 RepID=A0ABQ3Y1C1_9ACTN|nr:hypothetical protein [Actinoplanes deccanensis]GID73665.1 hypothetical protein Ade02nite_23060 [Actinoplanes deccanensis]